MPDLKTKNQSAINAQRAGTLYSYLSEADQIFLDGLTMRYAFSFQESRQLAEMARDFEMWGSEQFKIFWNALEERVKIKGSARRKAIFKEAVKAVSAQKHQLTDYSGEVRRPERPPLKSVLEQTDKKIMGDCPVASEKTVCCNLKTIDAVENCAYGCSYCTIQTFYGSKVVFDDKLAEKLDALELEPDRFYHIGTGQSSDALVWGNKNGMLDALCNFARKHPNILLEFKTKSANVDYFKARDIPRNIVTSWSLNPDAIVNHEEHFTASLTKRLEAARAAADQGVRVAFHFHPIVHYDGWKEDYVALAKRVQEMFSDDEVLFLSFGTVTFIKPVTQAIRKRGEPTKILQMEMVPDPHGKLTYPDDIKIELFRTVFEAFKPWHKNVFMYLCMEHARFWDEVFGWHYATNDEFERDFGQKTMAKLP